MKRASILASLVIAVTFVLPQHTTEWRGIVPLRSTRTQVEQILGPLNIQCQCYSTETEIIRVEYAQGACKGILPGWNVPADTVLSVEVLPKKPLLFSDLNLRTEDFVKTADDTVTTHYGNGESGFRYSVSSMGKVTSIWHGPSVKDNHLRCTGFPLSDGGVTTYRPYYKFSYETSDDVQDRLGEFGVRLLKGPEFRGYVMVYGTPGQKKDTVPDLVSRVRSYLVNELGVKSNALDVVEGGYREEPTVELFLIPRDWPRVIPTPSLG
jgi:hypothetical protein